MVNVLVAADGDPAGEGAAMLLAKRLAAEGGEARVVRLARAAQDEDFADQLPIPT